MDIRIFIFMILAVVACSSCHLPTRHAPNVPDSNSENIRGNHSVTGSDCVAAAHRDTHSILRTRMKRSRTGRVSLSSGSAPSPYMGPDNSTKTNATPLIQQSSPKTASWIPTLENVITPIFRTILLLLTLFNIDMTWRIHALHVGRRPLRHRIQPAGRGWPV